MPAATTPAPRTTPIHTTTLTTIVAPDHIGPMDTKTRTHPATTRTPLFYRSRKKVITHSLEETFVIAVMAQSVMAQSKVLQTSPTIIINGATKP